MSVSVVLAAHDEAGAIGRVVRAIRRTLPDAEVLVVDDGSTDATAAQAQAAGARVHSLAANAGKGIALRTGLDDARGAELVVLDADGQDDPTEIPRLLRALRGGADLVIGSRFLGRFDEGAIRPIDRVGNRALTSAFNLLYGTTLTDSQAGFRAMRAELWARLHVTARRYDVETDVLAQAVRAGARVVEVPVTRRPRHEGRTGLSAVRDGTRILRRMLAGRFVTTR